MKTSLLKELLTEGRVWLAQGNALPGPLTAAEQALFGVPEIDILGALGFGNVHEWALEHSLESKSKRLWFPPTFICSAILGQTIRSSSLFQKKSLLAWVGKNIWPTPHVLERTLPEYWNKHCIFLDSRNKDEKLWTIIQLLRSSAVYAVFADGSGLNFIATRRIQLAAQHQKVLCFLFRPAWELKRPSSAQTKWKISPLLDPHKGEDNDERWNIELVSGKGLLTPLSWNLEWKQTQQGALYLVKEPLRERPLLERQA